MSDNAQAGNMTDDIDSGQDESAVIRALRDELKSLKSDLRDAKTRAETIAESTRSEMLRRTEAQKVVSDLGYPKMIEDVVEKVEGEITVESVSAFLESRGLSPQASGADASASGSGSLSGELSSVANLGQRVASAASGTGAAGLMQRVDKRLAEATSAAEIAAIMHEAGLNHSR